MGSTILEGPAGWWKVEHAPLKYMIAECKREKFDFNLSQKRVRL